MMDTAIPMPKLGAKPPTEFLLFAYGATPTKKGTVFLTKESAKTVMDNFYADGTVLTFDVDHYTLADGAPGNFKLDLRDDGIWMSPIQWTEKYAKKISDGDFIYISPQIELNAEGEIEKIKKVALTNDPATKFIKPLLLSGNQMGSQTKLLQCMLASMQEAMRHGQTILSGVIMGDEKEMVAGQVEALAASCTKMMSTLEKSGVAPTAADVKEEEKEMYMDDDGAEDDGGGEDDGGDEELSDDGEKSDLLKTTVKKLPKTEKKLSSSDPIKKIMDIVGSTDVEETIGIILALKSKEEKLDLKLNDIKKTELKFIVEKAINDKKISASQREMFLSQSKKVVLSALSRLDAEDEISLSSEKVTKLAPQSGLSIADEMALKKIIGA